MNIQAKPKSPRSFKWKQIAIIAVVLGVAAFKFIDSRRNSAPQNEGTQNGGTAQLELPDEIDLDPELSKSGQSQKTSSKSDLKFKPLKGSTSTKSQQNLPTQNLAAPISKPDKEGKKFLLLV